MIRQLTHRSPRLGQPKRLGRISRRAQHPSPVSNLIAPKPTALAGVQTLLAHTWCPITPIVIVYSKPSERLALRCDEGMHLQPGITGPCGVELTQSIARIICVYVVATVWTIKTSGARQLSQRVIRRTPHPITAYNMNYSPLLDPCIRAGPIGETPRRLQLRRRAPCPVCIRASHPPTGPC